MLEENGRLLEENCRLLEENGRLLEKNSRLLEEISRRLSEDFNCILPRRNNQNNYNNLIETKIKANKLKEENKTCVICYEDFKDNDEAIFLPCFHLFHNNFINKWLKNKENCPLCKINVNDNLYN